MKENKKYVLAGDIGGTKTNLGLYFAGKGGPLSVSEATFSSRTATGLEEMIEKLLETHPVPVTAACFGIACPVTGVVCQPTNLPWSVSEEKLKKYFGWHRIELLNDLTATALAVPLIDRQALTVLNPTRGDKTGNMALLAPGTGLGQAILLCDQGRYYPMASEGGHVDFAPTDKMEVDLWQYLHKRFGHVSVERVLSGNGLTNIFEWLADGRPAAASSRVRQAMIESDPARVIAEHAINNTEPLCVDALMRFCRILGAVAGNLALTAMATGGIFLGGGIPPKILPVLEKSAFLKRYTDKGRFSDFVASIPVNVIRNDKAALIGAAQRAFELADLNSTGHT